MYKKILIPIDMSSPESASGSCTEAREMVDSTGAEVHLMNVVPGYSMPMVASYFPEGAQDKLKKDLTQQLEALAAKYFIPGASVSVVSGKRSQSIIELADEWGADLIMIGCGRKNRTGGERLLGSCSTAVADRANCSVLIVR